MTKTQIRSLQHGLNRFTHRRLAGVGPLLIDGDMGRATRKRIRQVKYYLGYTGKSRNRVKITPAFIRRLRHPASPLYSTPVMLVTGASRRRKQRRLARKRPSHGTATFDGIVVAAWIKPYLVWARDHGWKGTVASGYRTPEYSESLCIARCGQPSCPGTCAGRSSNHSGSDLPNGAVDVTDYTNFGVIIAKCPFQPRIFNALGAQDPVHFSTTGR